MSNLGGNLKEKVILDVAGGLLAVRSHSSLLDGPATAVGLRVWV